LLKQQPKQLSLWSILYDKIPKDHILKAINNAVDFTFINNQLESSCQGDGSSDTSLMSLEPSPWHLY
jgi:hypothetical protein